MSVGQFADSVRESISAVESVVRTITSSKSLKDALEKIEFHKALKDGLNKLYGFTSDEKGIRHALLEDGDARVDESDAQFMLGACASFVSYLIAKSRAGAM